jgi:hypothetical protein
MTYRSAAQTPSGMFAVGRPTASLLPVYCLRYPPRFGVPVELAGQTVTLYAPAAFMQRFHLNKIAA